MIFQDYHFKYFGSREKAGEFLDKIEQHGYVGRILKRRDDLYQVRYYIPEF